MEVDIRLIEPGDKLSGLSCGDAQFTPLKTFLQRKAHSFHIENLARTYGAFSGSKVVGYVTLVCGEIVLEAGDEGLIPDPTVSYEYKQYPALKIARLLVDSNIRCQGLATSLVDLAIGIAQETICPAIGCRFAVVDAKKPAVDFYSRYGFTILDTQSNKNRESPVMFFDLYKTAKSAGGG